jgi:sugar phosphate isomerase/epimerase
MYSFHRLAAAKQLDAFGFIAAAKDLGIGELEFLDLWIQPDDDYVARLQEAVNQAGAKVACVTLHRKLIVPDPEVRKQELELTRRWLKAAGRLGSPALRTDLGLPEDPQSGLRRAIEVLKELAKTCEEVRVKACLENHGGPDSVHSTADSILKIIEGVGSRWIGACPDFGNFAERRYEQLAQLAPQAVHVHAKTHTFDGRGENVEWDMGRCVDIFKQAGYQGCWAIEYEGRFNEFCPDETTGVRKSKELLKRYL